MTAFTVAGFGLLGTPGTSGFISKWYLALGALDKGWWPLVFLIVASSLIAVVYVGRVLEIVWLREPGPAVAQASDPPLSMLLPMLRAGRGDDLFRHRYGVDRRHRQYGRQGADRRAAMMAGLSTENLVLIAVLAPFVGALIIPLFHKVAEPARDGDFGDGRRAVLHRVQPARPGAERRAAGDADHPGRARPRHRVQGRAARHAVCAHRRHAVDRQFDLFDRLHARQQRAAPDRLLCLLRDRARQHHRHRLRQEPVHAVPVLRSADALDLSAGDAQAQRRRRARSAASIFCCCSAPPCCCSCRRSSPPGLWPARSTSRPAASSPARPARR